MTCQRVDSSSMYSRRASPRGRFATLVFHARVSVEVEELHQAESQKLWDEACRVHESQDVSSSFRTFEQVNSMLRGLGCQLGVFNKVFMACSAIFLLHGLLVHLPSSWLVRPSSLRPIRSYFYIQ
jgi:hypothetical protein